MLSGRGSNSPRPSSRLPSLRRLRMKSFLMSDSGLSSMSLASVPAVRGAWGLVGAAAVLPLGLLLVEAGVEALQERLALVLDDLPVALDGVVERAPDLLELR